MEILNWIKTNWGAITSIIGQIVILATLIVELTPSPRDNTFLETVKKFISIFGLANYDKSFIGKKEDWIFTITKLGFKVGIKYYTAKNKGYIPQIQITNKLYMPISNEFIKGKFIVFKWFF